MKMQLNLLIIPLVLIFIGIPGAFASDHNPEITNFVGHTDGWAIIDNEAQRASMSFVGNGTMTHNWELETTVNIDSNEKITVDLLGSANPENGKIRLTGTGKGPNNVEFVVILRGNFASIENLENVYALDWSYAGIHWFYGENDNEKIRLFQNGFLYAG